MLVNDLGEFFETLDEAIVVDAIAIAPARSRRVVHSRRLDHDEARAAPCHAFVEREHLGSHVCVTLVPHEHAGAGLDDAVAGGYRTDLARGEQSFVLLSHSVQRPFPMPE